MLAAAGIAFQPVEAELDEAAAKSGLVGAGFEPRDLAEELAQLKALGAPAEADDLVLGSDQVLECADGSLLSKPQSRDDAFGQLSMLRGTTHRLHASAVVVQGGAAVWNATETVAMTMRPFSDAFLHAYLDRNFEAIRWSVGGYQIEGEGVQLFERIAGSHFAVLGMPLLPLLSYLRERGLVAS
jgi:septum formation protein